MSSSSISENSQSELNDKLQKYLEEIRNCEGDIVCIEGVQEKWGIRHVAAAIAINKLSQHFSKRNWDYMHPVKMNEVKGFVLYVVEDDNTSNKNSDGTNKSAFGSVKEFINFYFNRHYLYPVDNRCVHAVIDGTTGKCYHTLPWQWKSSHSINEVNEKYVSIVMWLPKCRGEQRIADAKRAFDTAVQLVAMLFNELRFNHSEPNMITSEDELIKKILLEQAICIESDISGKSLGSNPDYVWKELFASDSDEEKYTLDNFRSEVFSLLSEPDKIKTYLELCCDM